MILNGNPTHFQDGVRYPNGFTGHGPWDRAAFEGYLAGGMVGEGIAFGSDGSRVGRGEKGVRELLAAVYHSIGLLRPMRDVGISVRTPADAGQTNGSTMVPTVFVTGAAEGFQMQAANDVLTYPCQGTTGAQFQMPDELPNPVPGRHLIMNPLGPVVVVKLRIGHTLSLQTVTMHRVSDGQAVVMRAPITGAADPNRRLDNDPHVGYAQPDAPLLPNTAYRVAITGTNNGATFQQNFTFTTGQ